MTRFSLALLFAAACLGGCSSPKQTEFKNKDEHGHDHVHEHDKMKLEDIALPQGKVHAGLTAHLSKKDGNDLDVAFETMDKEPKPVFLPANAKITGRVAVETGDVKEYPLTFEPAPKDERKDDPEGKCSRFTAKTPWLKRDDRMDVTIKVEIDGKLSTVTFDDFLPKKYAHVDE